jgi:hypothetical protein
MWMGEAHRHVLFLMKKVKEKYVEVPNLIRSHSITEHSKESRLFCISHLSTFLGYGLFLDSFMLVGSI